MDIFSVANGIFSIQIYFQSSLLKCVCLPLSHAKMKSEALFFCRVSRNNELSSLQHSLYNNNFGARSLFLSFHKTRMCRAAADAVQLIFSWLRWILMKTRATHSPIVFTSQRVCASQVRIWSAARAQICFCRWINTWCAGSFDLAHTVVCLSNAGANFPSLSLLTFKRCAWARAVSTLPLFPPAHTSDTNSHTYMRRARAFTHTPTGNCSRQTLFNAFQIWRALTLNLQLLCYETKVVIMASLVKRHVCRHFTFTASRQWNSDFMRHTWHKYSMLTRKALSTDN